MVCVSNKKSRKKNKEYSMKQVNICKIQCVSKKKSRKKEYSIENSEYIYVRFTTSSINIFHGTGRETKNKNLLKNTLRALKIKDHHTSKGILN